MKKYINDYKFSIISLFINIVLAIISIPFSNLCLSIYRTNTNSYPWICIMSIILLLIFIISVIFNIKDFIKNKGKNRIICIINFGLSIITCYLLCVSIFICFSLNSIDPLA